MADETEVLNELLALINERSIGTIANKDAMSSTFHNLGLDSEAAVAISGELSDRFGVDIDPLMIFEKPSIADFVEYVTARVSGGSSM